MRRGTKPHRPLHPQELELRAFGQRAAGCAVDHDKWPPHALAVESHAAKRWLGHALQIDDQRAHHTDQHRHLQAQRQRGDSGGQRDAELAAVQSPDAGPGRTVDQRPGHHPQQRADAGHRDPGQQWTRQRHQQQQPQRSRHTGQRRLGASFEVGQRSVERAADDQPGPKTSAQVGQSLTQAFPVGIDHLASSCTQHLGDGR